MYNPVTVPPLEFDCVPNQGLSEFWSRAFGGGSSSASRHTCRKKAGCLGRRWGVIDDDRHFIVRKYLCNWDECQLTQSNCNNCREWNWNTSRNPEIVSIPKLLKCGISLRNMLWVPTRPTILTWSPSIFTVICIAYMCRLCRRSPNVVQPSKLVFCMSTNNCHSNSTPKLL